MWGSDLDNNNNEIDLNAITQTGKYKVKIESIDDEHEDDATLRRKKDWYLFLAVLLILFIVFGVCIAIIFLKSSLASTALNGIIGLSSALVGYYAGGKNR